jgi:hypothetical protein
MRRAREWPSHVKEPALPQKEPQAAHPLGVLCCLKFRFISPGGGGLSGERGCRLASPEPNVR